METKNDGYVVINDLTCFAVLPGDTLQAELKERKIKQKDFALSIGMQPSHLSALIHGTRSITPAIAVKLEKGLGISATFWKNLQNNYNLDIKRIRERNLASGNRAPVKPYPIIKPKPMSVLAEPVSPSPPVRHSRVMLIIEDSDLEWLEHLSERMGWNFQKL